jgi:hypothetical protein
MLEFLARPLRSVLGAAEYEAARPVVGAEREISDAAGAFHRVADAIEHHIEVVEGLATSVGPLTESVNQLNQTMTDLVTLLAPMGAAEHGAQKVGRLFGFRHRHRPSAEPPTAPQSVAETPVQAESPRATESPPAAEPPAEPAA